MIQGRGPAPSLVLSMVMRLPDESMTVALVAGGREHFGWGVDRHLLADIYDALNQNTRATGMWEKKPPTIPPWPRPGTKKAEPEQPAKPKSVKDLYRMFQAKG